MQALTISSEDKKTVKDILDKYILPYQEQIALKTKRQTTFRAHAPVDACPILIGIDANIREKINAAIPVIIEKRGEKPDEEFFRILINSLRISAMQLMTDDDSIPTIYPAFGCNANLASLGMEQKREHGDYGGYGPPDSLSREEALKLTPDDVQLRGDLKKRVDFVKYARAMVEDKIPLVTSYTGGPFTFACQVMGTDFMMLTAAEPEVAHEFLGFCREAVKKILMWLREAGGADEHANTVLGGKQVVGGSRQMQMDIDEAVMFSPGAIDEFVIPSARDFAEACGLNIHHLHYCGWYEYFSRAIAQEPSIAAMNNNPVPFKGDAPFDLVMNLCAETNTIYAGYGPQYAGEDYKDYMKRLHKWAKKGIFIPEIRRVEEAICFSSSAELADYWRQL